KIILLLIKNQNGYSIVVITGFLQNGTTLKQFSESLGFEYIGVIDGHNTEDLIEVLIKIKKKKYPVFLHVTTQKGKGYKPAEKYPLVYHTPLAPFVPKNGRLYLDKMIPNTKMFGQITGLLQQKGKEYFQKYSNMYYVYPSLPVLISLKSEYPERVIDTAITEQHCMTFSTALVEAGNKVIMSMYGHFLARCYDQIFDLCMQQTPLTINALICNIAETGPTHQSIYVRNVLKLIPGLTIMEPVTFLEYEQMLDFCISYDKPLAILVPNTIIDDRSLELPYKSQLNNIKTAQGVVVKSGDKLTVLPAGSFFPEALKLSEELEEVELLHPRFLKPFDWELLQKSVEKTGKLLVLEESLKLSGVTADICHFLLEKGVHCQLKTVAVDDRFIPYSSDGTVGAIKSDLNLDYEAVKQKALELLS
ncbi:MAG: transketolase C-terminal domain-containing protein, partial [Ekhidna sp.]